MIRFKTREESLKYVNTTTLNGLVTRKSLSTQLTKQTLFGRSQLVIQARHNTTSAQAEPNHAPTTSPKILHGPGRRSVLRPTHSNCFPKASSINSLEFNSSIA